jgi:hypothetical protein
VPIVYTVRRVCLMENTTEYQHHQHKRAEAPPRGCSLAPRHHAGGELRSVFDELFWAIVVTIFARNLTKNTDYINIHGYTRNLTMFT